jgi:hypothetical protein
MEHVNDVNQDLKGGMLMRAPALISTTSPSPPFRTLGNNPPRRWSSPSLGCQGRLGFTLNPRMAHTQLRPALMERKLDDHPNGRLLAREREFRLTVKRTTANHPPPSVCPYKRHARLRPAPWLNFMFTQIKSLMLRRGSYDILPDYIAPHRQSQSPICKRQAGLRPATRESKRLRLATRESIENCPNGRMLALGRKFLPDCRTHTCPLQITLRSATYCLVRQQAWLRHKLADMIRHWCPLLPLFFNHTRITWRAQLKGPLPVFRQSDSLVGEVITR